MTRTPSSRNRLISTSASWKSRRKRLQHSWDLKETKSIRYDGVYCCFSAGTGAGVINYMISSYSSCFRQFLILTLIFHMMISHILTCGTLIKDCFIVKYSGAHEKEL